MEGFFGLLLILGIVGIVTSLVMRKKENIIGKNYKKILLGSAVAIAICCIFAAVTTSRTEPLDIDADIPEIEDSAASSMPVSSQSIAENSFVVSSSPVETASSSLMTVSSESDSNNPLLLAEWQTAPVMNGSKTEQIGKRGYVQITKADLKKITNEQMVEFAENRVKDSGLNGVSIICEDGTGVCFTGSSELVLSYGRLDSDGAILETLKDYKLNSGVYEEWA